MSSLKIGIVEDEMIIAEDMKDMLQQMGYGVTFMVVSASEARVALASHETDLMLIDIRIKGQETGIDLAKHVRQEYHIPFVFVTSNADRATVTEASRVLPYGYLVKPFDDRDLFSTIEIAMANFSQQNPEGIINPEAEDFATRDSLFVRDKKFLVKVKFQEVDYLEAEGNYTTLHTAKKKFTLRSTLKDVEAKLPEKQFVRIHKSYIIRLESLTGFNAQQALVSNVPLPIGRAYHDLLMQKINKQQA